MGRSLHSSPATRCSTRAPAIATAPGVRTLDREPDNADAAQLLASVKATTAEAIPVTTLGQEKRVNTFFRLHSPTVIKRLSEHFADLGEHPDPRTVFLKLRELRNSW
jgi:hydroxyacylglutathione hydrolase